MDPNSKRVWAVQLLLGWVRSVLSDVLEMLSPEGIPRTSRGSCTSRRHMHPVFAGLLPLLFASLNSVRFHGAFINGIFPLTLSGALLPSLCHLLETELIKGTNYTLQSLLPHLSHCPFYPETQTPDYIQTYKTPDSRTIHVIHS